MINETNERNERYSLDSKCAFLCILAVALSRDYCFLLFSFEKPLWYGVGKLKFYGINHLARVEMA